MKLIRTTHRKRTVVYEGGRFGISGQVSGSGKELGINLAADDAHYAMTFTLEEWRGMVERVERTIQRTGMEGGRK